MTRFVDGPAAGEVLTLTRAPVMLRAVKGPKGWDALDQPTDEAKRNEIIVVYILVSQPTAMFIDGRTAGGGRRWGMRVVSGQYRVLSDQPADAVMRDNTAWASWCVANKERLLELRTQLMAAPAARGPNG